MVFWAKNVYSSKEVKKSEREKRFTDDNYIYNREFKNEFTYEEFFNILMKNCDVRRHTGKKKLFMSEGARYNTIYYFVSIPKSALVTLKHQKTVISYLKENSWIGIVEFISQFFDDSKRTWVVGLEAENPGEQEIVWLEWNKDVFHKIFRKYKNTAFLKKLLMNWIRYLSLSTYKMDDHVAAALGVITNKNAEEYSQALPLCKIIYHY